MNERDLALNAHRGTCPRAKMLAASITWIRQGRCHRCGKVGLTGYLDGKEIARICTECAPSDDYKRDSWVNAPEPANSSDE